MVYRNIDGRNRNRRSNQFNAYKESMKGDNNMKTLEKIRMAKAIENVLPHGSGINGDWNITIRPDRVTCRNTYDHMDEYGMYDAYIDFSVIFKNDTVKVMFHNLNSKGYRFVNNDMLRQYLEDTFAECINAVETIKILGRNRYYENYYPYHQLSAKAKQKALQNLLEWAKYRYEDVAKFKSENYAIKFFSDYGWFFYADGERA